MYLRASEPFPSTKPARDERALDLVVPYTSPALTARALAVAVDLAQGFETNITLLAVYVLPYPGPLECQPGIKTRFEAELSTVARTHSVPIRARLVFARDRLDGFLGSLPRRALVVIGTKSRWWRTPEERLAWRLTARGHSVALIKVN